MELNVYIFQNTSICTCIKNSQLILSDPSVTTRAGLVSRLAVRARACHGEKERCDGKTLGKDGNIVFDLMYICIYIYMYMLVQFLCNNIC